MPRSLTQHPYTLLARFYDRLTPYAPAMNRHARGKILGRILARARSACDLGCGTGATALDFARRGLKVLAVDFSPTMCRLTREKAGRAHLPVRVLRGDMRRFRLPERVDLVTCEFSSLNHVRRNDLGGVLRSVARALPPGGWFYFDVNTAKAFEEELPRLKEKVETSDFVVFLSGSYNRRRRQARVDIDWFVRAGRLWRRRQEQIPHGWWTDTEIRRALGRAGFGRIRSWDGPEVRPAKMKSRPGHDTYYLAQKRRG
ncbi:MAG: class I SAM-dependent methyltransferase [Acidobacteria bacterium]|nr:class I SAM-dependent methyltransferase [Acidobacteriota bacterium]